MYSQFTQDPKKKHSFSLSLRLPCRSCHSVFSDDFTSLRAGAEHVHHLVKVNNQFLRFLREAGSGFAALKKICAVFGIKPTSKSVLYQKKQNRITDVMVDSAGTILSETVARVIEAYTESETHANFNGNITVTVSALTGHGTSVAIHQIMDLVP